MPDPVSDLLSMLKEAQCSSQTVQWTPEVLKQIQATLQLLKGIMGSSAPRFSQSSEQQLPDENARCVASLWANVGSVIENRQRILQLSLDLPQCSNTPGWIRNLMGEVACFNKDSALAAEMPDSDGHVVAMEAPVTEKTFDALQNSLELLSDGRLEARRFVD